MPSDDEIKIQAELIRKRKIELQRQAQLEHLTNIQRQEKVKLVTEQTVETKVSEDVAIRSQEQQQPRQQPTEEQQEQQQRPGEEQEQQQPQQQPTEEAENPPEAVEGEGGPAEPEGLSARGPGEAAELGAAEGAAAGASAAAGTGVGGAAAGGTAAATAPFWGPALGIFAVIALFFGLALFLIFIMVSACNSTTANVAKTVLSAIPFGGGLAAQSWDTAVCGPLKIVQSPPSGGGGASAGFPLDIVLTSAYRPGAIVAGSNPPRLSAHSRGEAVDIALQNPTVPKYASDPRIAQLVQIAESAGFVPAAGNTLDEYTNALEGTTGGHIHIEFNLRPNGTTYCDDAITPISGPTDLVPIPSSIPRSGVSDPRLRQCMLDEVLSIFSAAASQY